jgi:hypothetical protein
MRGAYQQGGGSRPDGRAWTVPNRIATRVAAWQGYT